MTDLSPALHWILGRLDELPGVAVFDLLQLRSEVFVMEQRCLYLDPDEKDRRAYHLLGYLNDKLVACARIVPPGVSYPEPSIGRVCTHPDFRKAGYGIELMHEAIRHTRTFYPGRDIRISAQEYLLAFYQGLGFIATGNAYLEDDIPHVEMWLPASSKTQ